MRHPARSSDEDREDALTVLPAGVDDSGIAPPPADPQLAARRARRMLGLPAIVLLRDLGPLPGDKLAHTVWRKGMRRRQRRRRHPDQARARCEIGQLINAEPAIFYEERGRRAEVRGRRRSQQAKAKAAIIIVRMKPDDITPAPGPRELGRRGHPVLLQDLHPRRVPDLAVGAADPPPALPLPPVDLRPGRQRQGDLRPGRPGAAAAADHGGRRGLPRRPERLHRAGRPQLLGTWVTTMSTSDAPTARRRPRPPKPNQVGGRRHLGRRAHRPRRRSRRSRSARSSRTTGPSCSARSRCGASSSCC